MRFKVSDCNKLSTTLKRSAQIRHEALLFRFVPTAAWGQQSRASNVQVTKVFVIGLDASGGSFY